MNAPISSLSVNIDNLPSASEQAVEFLLFPFFHHKS